MLPYARDGREYKIYCMVEERTAGAGQGLGGTSYAAHEKREHVQLRAYILIKTFAAKYNMQMGKKC